MTEDHGRRINRVLTAAFRRLPPHEAVELRTPDQEVMEAEEAEGNGFGGIEPDHYEAIERFLLFVYAKGPDPRVLLQRLCAVVYKVKPELLKGMGYRHLADLFGETPAAVMERTKLIFGDRIHARGQKRMGASAAYAAKAAGNNHRHAAAVRARAKRRTKQAEWRNGL